MKMHVKVALTALMVATFFAMILSDDASAQSSNQPTLTGVSISRGSGSNMDVTLSYRPPKTGPRPKVYEYWMMRPGQSYPGTKIGQSNAPSKRKLRLPSSKLKRGEKARFMVRAVLPNGATKDSNVEWAYGYCHAFRTKRASFGPKPPRITGAKAVCKKANGKVTECRAELRISRSSSSGIKDTIVHAYPKGEEPKWYPGGGVSLRGPMSSWKGPRVLYRQTRCYRVRDEAGVGKPVSRMEKRRTYGSSEPSTERCITFDQLPPPPSSAKPRPAPRHVCD